MSISSPLPSTTFSNKPLQLTLSLETLPCPTSSLLKDNSSTSTTPSSEYGDIFDELDRERPRLGGYQEEEDAGAEEEERQDQGQPRQSSDALADSSSLLYPTADLQLERKLAIEGTGGSDGQLPDWLRETSGKVMSIAVGNVYKEELEARKDGDEDDERRRQTKRSRRVAVGTEGGVVWIFRDRGESPRTVRPRRPRHDREATIVPSSTVPPPSLHTTATESFKARPHRPSPTASRPSSPLPPSGSSLSPRLTTRRSSASLSTLSSFTSQSATRNASGPPSLNGSTTTYSELRSLPDQRLRKASATVSVSTTSVTPAPSHRHSSSESQASTTLQQEQDSSSVTLPPMSPVENTTYPLSPIPTRPPPHFRFSPSTPSNDSEPRSSPSARSLHSSTTGLSSKKEQQSREIDSRNRSHSRGTKKESITNGIGLWETSSSIQLPTPETGGQDGLGIVTGSEGEVEIEEEGWERSELEPVLKILSPGFGRVEGLAVLAEDDLPYSGYQKGREASDVLVVLRQSGHLSILNLVDGRCLGTCELGKDVDVSFGALEVIRGAQGAPMALCSAKDASSSVICVELNTLSVTQTIEDVEHFATLSNTPQPSMLYCSPNSNELFTKPLPSPSKSTTAVKSLGFLETRSAIKGLRMNGKLVVAWDEKSLFVATVEHVQISPIASILCEGIQDVAVQPEGDDFVVATRETLQSYRFFEIDGQRQVKSETQQSFVGGEAFCLVTSPTSTVPFKLLLATFNREEGRTLEYLELESTSMPRSLFRSSLQAHSRVQPTRARKLDSESTLVGFSNGAISLLPISSLGKTLVPPMENVQLTAAITVLDVIDLGAREIVIAGTANGTVGFWNLSDWEEIAGFALFASPVLSYAKLSLPSHPHTLLFVSCNSPIALVSPHPPQLLFTLPGSRTPVQLVATTKQGEVMVLYKQGLARVWDAETGELRRSMDRKTAENVLKEKEKGWRTWFDYAVENAGSSTSSLVHPSISFDLRTTLDDAARDLPWAVSKQRTPKKLLNGFDSLDATPDISRAASPAPFSSGSTPQFDHLEIIKSWLSSLVPFGLDKDCDQALEQLEIAPPPVQLALASQQPRSLAFSAQPLSKTAWTTSPHSTAQRLLLITCLLRVFLNYPATERCASETIVYFSACLEASVGDEFQRPCLEYFADYWLDKNAEVQQAAKTLFGTYLAALSDEDTLALVHDWEEYLPSRQASRGSPHSKADTAVLLVGLIAVDRYKLLSASVLTSISVSIASYLEESQHAFHQALATELCSRGFHIWQNYVDAMSLVRQLFSIAIGRNPSTPSDLRAMARQATVHVAGVNSPLFMSTLLFDILNAPTVVSRNATLKLLGFMIRKKPLVLYHSLPRVVEAVVKSLDPTMGDLRETVQQTATVILNELVRTFPSIDFHGKSQRLAVGTQEGSAIVYDLKTATRLYVLEGHRRPLTAVSWSPDGHRLATVSLDENKVCIWKTGMGILSLIGAPTQRAGSPPFKEWDFHVGDEALMTTAATLEWIIVDWPAERTVRLRIRETALSFGA